MDELTRYIVNYYPNLMTPKEAAAYKTSFVEEKAENLEPGGANYSAHYVKDGDRTILKCSAY